MKFNSLAEIPPPIQLRIKLQKGDRPVVPSHLVNCQQCGNRCWESDSMGIWGETGTVICDVCMVKLIDRIGR